MLTANIKKKCPEAHTISLFFSYRWWILEPCYLFLSPAICGSSNDWVPQMPDVGPLVLCQDKERPSTQHLHMPKMSAISGQEHSRQEHSRQEHSGQAERREDEWSQLILAFTSNFRPDSHLLISLFLFHCLCYSPPFLILPIIAHRLLCFLYVPASYPCISFHDQYISE